MHDLLNKNRESIDFLAKGSDPADRRSESKSDRHIVDSVKKEDPSLFDLIVSEDKSEAYICVKGELPGETTVGAVKNFIQEKGISYGLVDEAQIEQYLTQEAFKGKSWLIAKGKLPKPGQDARWIYHFDKDSLKIGTVKAGGAVDFKDKGKIPQVAEGALLAEKIPLVKGEAGLDVYGQIRSVPEAQDITILCGENTQLSKDGLKIFSKKRGRPVISADGRLSVYPELTIDGDVGLETGHINFNGFINVNGVIQEGFRVRGGSLSAKEIYKADVEIEGDIAVDGGIIGSKIISKGNIRARDIHSSVTEALGDTFVEEEVMHSKIETDGFFVAHSLMGKILSSQITAWKGIEANQIGSDSSKPCILLVGVDSISKKLISNNSPIIQYTEFS